MPRKMSASHAAYPNESAGTTERPGLRRIMEIQHAGCGSFSFSPQSDYAIFYPRYIITSWQVSIAPRIANAPERVTNARRDQPKRERARDACHRLFLRLNVVKRSEDERRYKLESSPVDFTRPFAPNGITAGSEARLPKSMQSGVAP
ncbi:hypothetical protein SKAU_G00009160 [Synaphobranchus kaupii]|uniref:Uncharacterized protein n=1 Tax=Synaphobranchus kaupii TaxID=118154 RepID=A0A9Q1GAL0_SYNKA|nr:hypothetical protein SKAU_G00009160 [Synaphobranchus kaupii]